MHDISLLGVYEPSKFILFLCNLAELIRLTCNIKKKLRVPIRLNTFSRVSCVLAQFKLDSSSISLLVYTEVEYYRPWVT